MSRLEAQVIEQGSKLTTRLLSMDDKFLEFRAKMTTWKNEMTELMRLNRPPPPVIDPSFVNGRSPSSHPHQVEASQVHGRRLGKEPTAGAEAENLEVVLDDQGLGENTPAFQRVPRPVDLNWAPRRGHIEARQQNPNHGGDIFMRYKQEFPPFDYEQPWLWIIRCERFFMLSRIPRDDVLNIFCVNLTGKVGVWFENYTNGLRSRF